MGAAGPSLLIISNRNGGDLVWEALLYFCEVICILPDLHTAEARGSPGWRSPRSLLACLIPEKRMVIIKLAEKQNKRRPGRRSKSPLNF